MDLPALIRRMSVDNPLWEAPRIHGELLKLGLEVAQSSVAKYMVKPCGPRRDRVYGAAVTHRLRAMGIRDKPIAPGSPWQNGFAGRLIGSIRRERIDHIVVLGEAHLRRIPVRYAAYYNKLRTYRSLGKDAPIPRPSSTSAASHPGRSEADFITIIVEFNFRYGHRGVPSRPCHVHYIARSGANF